LLEENASCRSDERQRRRILLSGTYQRETILSDRVPENFRRERKKGKTIDLSFSLSVFFFLSFFFLGMQILPGSSRAAMRNRGNLFSDS